MEIVKQLKQRQMLLIEELEAIKTLIRFYDKSLDLLPKSMTLREVYMAKIVPVRVVNCTVAMGIFGDRRPSDIILGEFRDVIRTKTHSELLLQPNFGRRSYGFN